MFHEWVLATGQELGGARGEEVGVGGLGGAGKRVGGVSAGVHDAGVEV